MQEKGWYRIAALLLVFAAAPAFAGILDSRHNLAVSGPGDVKVGGATQVCIFCHTRYNPTGAATGRLSSRSRRSKKRPRCSGIPIVRK